MQQISLILHDIRSSENVGSIFRSADGSGATKIYLSGYTPAPLDRFGRENVKLAKAALGSEKSMAWEQVQDLEALITSLRSGGVRVVAVEQDPRSVPYDSFSDEGRVALVLGNEVEGVPKKILDMADAIVEIPMRGRKESLNVAVAAGIVLYRFANSDAPRA